MFKFAQDLISSVFGRKRTLDEVEVSQDEEHVNKKVKADVIHRIRVTNLPRSDMPTLKKFFKNQGYTRFKKAPKWDYCFLTVDVRIIF